MFLKFGDQDGRPVFVEGVEIIFKGAPFINLKDGSMYFSLTSPTPRWEKKIKLLCNEKLKTEK